MTRLSVSSSHTWWILGAINNASRRAPSTVLALLSCTGCDVLLWVSAKLGQHFTQFFARSIRQQFSFNSTFQLFNLKKQQHLLQIELNFCNSLLYIRIHPPKFPSCIVRMVLVLFWNNSRRYISKISIDHILPLNEFCVRYDSKTQWTHSCLFFFTYLVDPDRDQIRF